MQIIGFMTPGPTEVIVILLLVLLLFGAKRLPELARSLGKSLNEFKRGRDESERSEQDEATIKKSSEAESRPNESDEGLKP